MRLYVLPVMIGFLAGLVLDLSVTRFLLDLVLFGTVVATVAATLLIAHYHNPYKKLPSRIQPKVVKSRKKFTDTSGRRPSNFNR